MFSFFRKKREEVTFDWLGTDIHSHLLPGIDDGSTDPDTSISYLKALNELGFSKFICTPHIFKELYPNTQDTIETALANVIAHRDFKQLGIEIAAAAEYMIDPDFDDIFKEDHRMILPGNFILIEMPFLSEAHDMEKTIFSICLAGLKPILAHPERYGYYGRDQSRLLRFKEMGCLLQLNLLSMTGYYGKDAKDLAQKLMKSELYALAGTDFHHQRHLAVFRKPEAWQATIGKLRDYPFKNKELFG